MSTGDVDGLPLCRNVGVIPMMTRHTICHRKEDRKEKLKEAAQEAKEEGKAVDATALATDRTVPEGQVKSVRT